MYLEHRRGRGELLSDDAAAAPDNTAQMGGSVNTLVQCLVCSERSGMKMIMQQQLESTLRWRLWGKHSHTSDAL